MTSEKLRHLLHAYWGFESFRPGQQEIIETILRGQDTLALLPTGGGKSLCYQLPALAQEGCCLVVSPLIALMEDQVAKLTERNIPAVAFHAGLSGEALQAAVLQVRNGACKLIYCSPERLRTRAFGELMSWMKLSLIAVDEAHCVSQWGHDFRPEYLGIAPLRQHLPGVPVLALTATATPSSIADICQQLGLRQPTIFQQSFSRPNIFYELLRSENKAQDCLHALRKTPGAAIVYCRSRRQTESLCRILQEEGLQATHYHAGMKPEARSEAQVAWMEGIAPVIVCTTAFGMGIDKADVRCVIHWEPPEDLESWYQETGRCGRDGLPAQALTLFSPSDLRNLKNSTKLQYPDSDFLRQVYQHVNEYLQVAIGMQPDRYFPFELTDFCKKFSLRTAAVLPAMRLLAREGLWTLTESVFQPPTVQFRCDRHTLDSFQRQYPQLGLVCVSLLRLYAGIFQFPVPIHEHALARKLHWKRKDITRALAQLASMGIIDWTPVAEGPQLFYTHYRVDSRHLILNTDRLRMLRDRHEARSQAMIQFLEDESLCKGKAIERYFGGQETGPCGHCSVCKKTIITYSAGRSLREEILHLLAQNTLPLPRLTSQFPEARREDVIHTLRALVERGHILWHPDNSFSLPRKK
ncbi:MAG: RecQ family ATP-dependent DNA helicase [Bacteroidetes bacterium]|nr:RecQ family ATP-dependent DNA helicase [Bacteroidota bacterium]